MHQPRPSPEDHTVHGQDIVSIRHIIQPRFSGSSALTGFWSRVSSIPA
ncbi:MAG: hypothetical protein R3E95_04550 [Thiolinea sp.]